MFFEGYTEKLWGRHPSGISAEWGSQRVKGLSISAVIMDMLRKLTGKKSGKVETSLIESFQYPKFGPGQLWEKVASEVKNLGGEVLTGCEVTGLSCKDGRISAVKYNKDGSLFESTGDFIISTMPIKDLVSGMDCEKPQSISDAAAGLPYRDFMTVGLLLNRLKLQNRTEYKTFGNIVPDCWIYVQDTSVRLGRIQIFNNWSPYLVSDPENTVWVGLEYFCHEGDELWSMTESQAIDFAISELISIGIIEKEDVLDSHRELIKKAYPAYFDTYTEIESIKDFLNGFTNLYCIGRNGQHRYNNMDHSMVTAFEAVESIISGKTDKTDIWNVNTEKEYHEKA
jgi:protoporphyrinogen oxidase